MEETPTATTHFSPRSQRSLKAELELRAQARELKLRVAGIEGLIDRLRERKEGVERNMMNDPGFVAPWYNDVVKDLAGEEAKKDAFNARADLLEKEADSIAGVALANQAEREQKQLEIAGLVGVRLKHDEKINNALGGLRDLLAERDKLTDGIASLCEEISLDANLNGRLYEHLEAALSEDFLEASERWAQNFLGERGDLKAYEVEDYVVKVPETLASAGIFIKGETALLSDEDAAPLLRTDRMDPRSQGLFLPAGLSLRGID